MKNNIRRGSWFVTVPLAAVAVAYVAFVFLPGRRAVGELKQQISQKQEFITQATGVVTSLGTTREELEGTRAYNGAWRQRAPAARKLSAFYGQIYELTKAAGTATTRFDPEPVVTRNQIREIPLTMGCAGSFAQVYEFLRGLEGLPAEIWVDRLQLEKSSEKGGLVNCELSLVVFACNPENSDYVEDSE